jgi:hypothetical protein
MSYFQHSDDGNRALHERLAAAIANEAIADALCEAANEHDEDAEAAWGEAVDERIDCQNAITDAPVRMREDVIAKVRIIVHHAKTFGPADMTALIAQFADQVTAFARVDA